MLTSRLPGFVRSRKSASTRLSFSGGGRGGQHDHIGETDDLVELVRGDGPIGRIRGRRMPSTADHRGAEGPSPVRDLEPIPPRPMISHVVPQTSRQSWICQRRPSARSRHWAAPWNSSSTERTTYSAIGKLLTWVLVIRSPRATMRPEDRIVVAGTRRLEPPGPAVSSMSEKNGAERRALEVNRSDVPQATSGWVSAPATAEPCTSLRLPSRSIRSHPTSGRARLDDLEDWWATVVKEDLHRAKLPAEVRMRDLPPTDRLSRPTGPTPLLCSGARVTVYDDTGDDDGDGPR